MENTGALGFIAADITTVGAGADRRLRLVVRFVQYRIIPRAQRVDGGEMLALEVLEQVTVDRPYPVPNPG